MLSISELIIILIIVLILFGTERICSTGKGLGKAVKGFKKGFSEGDEIDVTPIKEEAINEKKS